MRTMLVHPFLSVLAEVRGHQVFAADGQPVWGDRWRWHPLDGLARLRQATSHRASADDDLSALLARTRRG
jgi:hypothetical protein